MARQNPKVVMDLSSFLPYRIAVLSESVSQCIAQVYRERFGLTRDEWRVLAALADAGKVKTSAVIASTTLEKMQVSRAVSRMERDGLLERLPDPDDGRGWLLRLHAGRPGAVRQGGPDGASARTVPAGRAGAARTTSPVSGAEHLAGAGPATGIARVNG